MPRRSLVFRGEHSHSRLDPPADRPNIVRTASVTSSCVPSGTQSPIQSLRFAPQRVHEPSERRFPSAMQFRLKFLIKTNLRVRGFRNLFGQTKCFRNAGFRLFGAYCRSRRSRAPRTILSTFRDAASKSPSVRRRRKTLRDEDGDGPRGKKAKKKG